MSGSRPRALTRAFAVLAASLALAGLAATSAFAQRAKVTVDSRGGIYAGLPFTLAVSAEGFDETPEPKVADFTIPGCKMSYLGMSPSVATSISIINGQRNESRRVEFVYRYRVECDAPGTYQVPAIKITQGQKSVTTQQGRFQAESIQSSPDMRIELVLPDRPVSVGEAFDVSIDWYLREQPDDQSIVVPFLDAQDWIDVHTPPASGRQRTIPFTAGDREIELPYTAEKAMLGSIEYTRLRFTVTVTPIQAGTLTIEPTRVVASLPTGMGRDAFGFPSRRYELFKAEDRERTLAIRPLPLKDRPPSFSNAVGTSYSIQVQASRTVVKLGEPVELTITLRGDGRMESLSLPDLTSAEGLPQDSFSVADTPSTGEVIDNGKAKQFRVTARILNPNVREIPPIAFSYFNPATDRYETVKSEPIALSVEGSAVVGANEVVSAVKSERPSAPTQPTAGPAELASFIGADLSLSAPGDTLARPFTVSDIRLLLIALYALPIALLLLRIWQLGTRERRGQSSEKRQAMAALVSELERAKSQPARESGPKVLAALRAVAAATGRDSLRGEGVVARIETEAYSPKAATAPLDAALIADVKALAQRWSSESSERVSAKAAAVLVPWLAIGLLGSDAHAQEAQSTGAAMELSPDITIDAARDAYQRALGEKDRNARATAFARAERLYRQLAQSRPGRPELLTDWGNAALGAYDLGRATLAYRQALALDPGLTRAERNLSWVRSRAPTWLPRPEDTSAGTSLFFWHQGLSTPTRHLLAAAAFAAMVLLLVPWGVRQRLLRRLAIVPAIVWVAMLASVLIGEPPTDDAVVINDGVAFLSADSQGAPPALPNPLPAGAEVTIVEARDAWTRVALADGTKGWVPAAAIARVVPE